MSILTAISDMKSEIRSGMSAEDAAALTAPEYNLNPALLLRKFREAHLSDVGVVGAESHAKRLEAAIQHACTKYNVDRSWARVVTFRGKPATLICRLTNCPKYRFLVVDHATAGVMRVTNVTG